MPRVLVVEDDAAISLFIAEVLSDEGFDVDTAENGAVGMAKLRERSPDLITLDLMMPVMDGWEFMRRCRVELGCAARRILVVSAARPGSEEFGECEYLPKPFDLNDLLQTVGRLVERGLES